MVSSGEFYSSVLIPPVQNNHTLAVRSAVSVHQKRGCFSAGTVYSSALFLMVPEQSEETNQPQRGMVWWCWNRLFCCSVLRGSEQSEQTGCWGITVNGWWGVAFRAIVQLSILCAIARIGMRVKRVQVLHAVWMVFLSRVFRFWSGCGVVGVVECIPRTFSRCAGKIAG